MLIQQHMLLILDGELDNTMFSRSPMEQLIMHPKTPAHSRG